MRLYASLCCVNLTFWLQVDLKVSFSRFPGGHDSYLNGQLVQSTVESFGSLGFHLFMVSIENYFMTCDLFIHDSDWFRLDDFAWEPTVSKFSFCFASPCLKLIYVFFDRIGMNHLYSIYHLLFVRWIGSPQQLASAVCWKRAFIYYYTLYFFHQDMWLKCILS